MRGALQVGRFRQSASICNSTSAAKGVLGGPFGPRFLLREGGDPAGLKGVAQIV